MAVLIAVLPLAALRAEPPRLQSVFPLGATRGSVVEIEILGESLQLADSIEFDCLDLKFLQIIERSESKLRARISIAATAALGPHMLRVKGRGGYSTSGMFNAGQFPAYVETPGPAVQWNNQLPKAQSISALPVEIYGRLDGAPDLDIYAIRVRAGERWAFDFRSIEFGSAVEAKMALLDESGKRIAFNDDKDDYDETPYIEHTFPAAGLYFVQIDQYRGPRGFNFGKNSSYLLRISKLPRIETVFPLGLTLGTRATLRLGTGGAQRFEKVWITEARRAETARMTYPYTMPIAFREDPRRAEDVARIEGTIRKRDSAGLDADFEIPSAARAGLWRVWASGPDGTREAGAVELNGPIPFTADGIVPKSGAPVTFRVPVKAGVPLHVYTLAAQLGVPHLDSVLEVRDDAGRKLAESDDVVAGYGTLLGNPDSGVYLTPQVSGELRVAVRDRLGRGGAGYEFRLKAEVEPPSIQLFTTPENFTVTRGGKAVLKVHLIREAGQKGPVDIWIEGLPAGVAPQRTRFRADQLFEPNADGADILMPEYSFEIEVPAGIAAGDYPIRVLGRADGDARTVQAQTTMIMGPLLDAWNYVRRPLPQVTMTVVEPLH